LANVAGDTVPRPANAASLSARERDNLLAHLHHAPMSALLKKQGFAPELLVTDK
jgi:hypothetical protein